MDAVKFLNSDSCCWFKNGLAVVGVHKNTLAVVGLSPVVSRAPH
jgi:hypothetical protein